MTLIKRLHDWANKHEWLLFLMVLVIGLRVPSLIMPHYYGDEEIYFVMGRAWASDVPLYQAMFDHKPPLIYILAGLFPTMWSWRLMLLVSMLLHTWIFWELAKRFWAGVRPGMAQVSSLIFVILTSLPMLEGLTVNAELLMMLPVTAGVLLLWEARIGDWRRFGLAGLIIGIGWLYKIPVVADAAAIGLFFLPFRGKSLIESLKLVVSWEMLAYISGFVAPLALTFGYYFVKGHGSAYLDTVLTMNLGYVSSWSTSAYSFNPFRSGLVVRATILAGFTLILYLARKKLQPQLLLASLWLAFAIFGALLSGRPYPHYLQQPVVPFALWLPWIVVNEYVLAWVVWGISLGLMLLMQWQIKFWGYPTISVYRDFWQYMSRQISWEDYRNRFDNTKRNYAVASYLNQRLTASDQIYVWGSDPTIYNLTNRLPTGGKYIVSFHVHDLKKHDYVYSELNKHWPKYIVWLPGTTEFEQLQQALERDYDLAATIESVAVYRRQDE